MTLNQIVYFQTVARCQHFRLAASELNISQPSLSRSISNLEDELGIVLFERKGRTVTLTKYGRIFLEHADRILNDVALAEKQMKRLAGSSGHVDIAYVFPLAAWYIPHMVRQFLAGGSNEKISFNFHQTNTYEMVNGLKAENYDVIFGAYVEDEPGIQFVPILKQEMIIITPLGHPLASKENVSLKDLEGYPVIGYDRNSGLGKFTLRTYASYSLQPNIICESPDENAIASLVAEDFGIALIADVDILEHFQLEKLHLTDISLQHTVYMGYLRDHYQIPAVRSFISFIKKEGSRI
ncbi:MAG TPA: LysR family transcriptional regulator [Candidatus Mediterraneibacter vanvlietii]|nr:LysR family transcriptional regulator [Candidatus Mediterraneibacter vanvlietii]